LSNGECLEECPAEWRADAALFYSDASDTVLDEVWTYYQCTEVAPEHLSYSRSLRRFTTTAEDPCLEYLIEPNSIEGDVELPETTCDDDTVSDSSNGDSGEQDPNCVTADTADSAGRVSTYELPIFCGECDASLTPAYLGEEFLQGSVICGLKKPKDSSAIGGDSPVSDQDYLLPESISIPKFYDDLLVNDSDYELAHNGEYVS